MLSPVQFSPVQNNSYKKNNVGFSSAASDAAIYAAHKAGLERQLTSLREQIKTVPEFTDFGEGKITNPEWARLNDLIKETLLDLRPIRRYGA